MFLNKNVLYMALLAFLLTGCSFDLTEQGVRNAKIANRTKNANYNEFHCTDAGGKIETRNGIVYCRVSTQIVNTWESHETY